MYSFPPEKYPKAYIVANELDFRKIHDLPVLLKTCLQANSELASLNAACKSLNRFYIETRYPVHWPTHYTKDETVKAKACAEQIRDMIRISFKPVPPCDPQTSFEK